MAGKGKTTGLAIATQTPTFATVDSNQSFDDDVDQMSEGAFVLDDQGSIGSEPQPEVVGARTFCHNKLVRHPETGKTFKLGNNQPTIQYFNEQIEDLQRERHGILEKIDQRLDHHFNKFHADNEKRMAAIDERLHRLEQRLPERQSGRAPVDSPHEL